MDIFYFPLNNCARKHLNSNIRQFRIIYSNDFLMTIMCIRMRSIYILWEESNAPPSKPKVQSLAASTGMTFYRIYGCNGTHTPNMYTYNHTHRRHIKDSRSSTSQQIHLARFNLFSCRAMRTYI